MSGRLLGFFRKHEYRLYAAVSHFFLSAILASSALLVSPLSAQQEQQSQQERSSSADAVAENHVKAADEEKTDQHALPTLQTGTSRSGTSPLGTSQLGTSNDRLFNLLPSLTMAEGRDETGSLPARRTASRETSE